MNQKDNLIEELASKLNSITEDYDEEQYIGEELINQIAKELNTDVEYDDITDDYILNYNNLEIHYSEEYKPDYVSVTITDNEVDMSNNLPEGTEIGEDAYIVDIPASWSLSKIIDTIKKIDDMSSNKQLDEKRNYSKDKKIEGVSWSYYEQPELQEIEDKYLPGVGEGDNFAQQIVTAITKLIYKYYNDGDRYDAFSGNDMTSFANWLYKYVPGASDILDNTDTDTDSYEYVLRQLNDKFLNKEFLAKCETQSKKGSIYDCEGPYEFEDDDYEEDEEW